MKTTDVALLLISSSFAVSKFIKEYELAEFLKRKKADGFLIFPVLLRNYDFKEFEDISSLNFFKTFYKDYDIGKITDKDKLMPFDFLVEGKEANDRLRNDYYFNIAGEIHRSVSHFLLNKKNY